MKSKTYCIIVIVTTICMLCGVAGLTYRIDPFMQYHIYDDRTYFINAKYSDYWNAGMAKNMNYKTVVCGSCMSENSQASEYVCAGGIVKLTTHQTTWYDINKILKLAFLSGNNIENVYFALDIWQTIDSSTYTEHTYPETLYNTTILDDAAYLLNKEIILSTRTQTVTPAGIIDSTPTIAWRAGVELFDSIYAWGNHRIFEKEKCLNGYRKYRKDLHCKQYDFGSYLKKMQYNFDKNLKPYFEEHPDVEFYIYIPPYSILFWDQERCMGRYTYDLKSLELLLPQLLKYDNVHLFLFSNEEKVVCELDNYCDIIHYSPRINHWILKNMRDSNYLLTEDNYKEELNKLYKLIERYDYGLTGE